MHRIERRGLSLTGRKQKRAYDNEPQIRNGVR